jgi:hypothetical protein
MTVVSLNAGAEVMSPVPTAPECEIAQFSADPDLDFAAETHRAYKLYLFQFRITERRMRSPKLLRDPTFKGSNLHVRRRPKV